METTGAAGGYKFVRLINSHTRAQCRNRWRRSLAQQVAPLLETRTERSWPLIWPTCPPSRPRTEHERTLTSGGHLFDRNERWPPSVAGHLFAQLHISSRERERHVDVGCLIGRSNPLNELPSHLEKLQLQGLQRKVTTTQRLWRRSWHEAQSYGRPSRLLAGEQVSAGRFTFVVVSHYHQANLPASRWDRFAGSQSRLTFSLRSFNGFEFKL